MTSGLYPAKVFALIAAPIASPYSFLNSEVVFEIKFLTLFLFRTRFLPLAPVKIFPKITLFKSVVASRCNLPTPTSARSDEGKPGVFTSGDF